MSGHSLVFSQPSCGVDIGINISILQRRRPGLLEGRFFKVAELVVSQREKEEETGRGEGESQEGKSETHLLVWRSQKAGQVGHTLEAS